GRLYPGLKALWSVWPRLANGAAHALAGYSGRARNGRRLRAEPATALPAGGGLERTRVRLGRAERAPSAASTGRVTREPSPQLATGPGPGRSQLGGGPAGGSPSSLDHSRDR